MEPTVVYFSNSFTKSKELSCNDSIKGKEPSTEDNIIQVGEDLIIIDEDTTFVDEDGNSLKVKQSFQGGNSVLLVEKCDDNCTTEKKSLKGTQEKTSTMDSLSGTLNKEEDDTIMELSETVFEVPNEGTRPFTVKLISLPKEEPESKTQITLINKATKQKYFFEGTPQNVNPDIKEVTEMDKLTCPYCLKQYMCLKSIKRHMESTHKLKWVMRHNINNLIRCVECNISFPNLKELRYHLCNKHNMKMDAQELRFPNIEGNFF